MFHKPDLSSITQHVWVGAWTSKVKEFSYGVNRALLLQMPALMASLRRACAHTSTIFFLKESRNTNPLVCCFKNLWAIHSLCPFQKFWNWLNEDQGRPDFQSFLPYSSFPQALTLSPVHSHSRNTLPWNFLPSYLACLLIVKKRTQLGNMASSDKAYPHLKWTL